MFIRKRCYNSIRLYFLTFSVLFGGFGSFGQAGLLDFSFGSGGKVVSDFGSNSYDEGKSLAIQNDGKILVAGASGSDFALIRYKTDGTLDNTFGSSGKVLTSLGSLIDVANSISIQNDGKIILAGTTSSGYDNNDIALVRYNNDGTLDSTFDLDGKVITAFSINNEDAYSVAIQSDGKIIVGGSNENSANFDEFALVRYNPDGSIDNSFGTAGKVNTAMGTFQAYGKSLAIQNDGKIILAGSKTNGSPNWDDFALVRYQNNGSLDLTFGVGGIVTTDFSNRRDNGNSMVIQSDGKIIVAGWSEISSNSDFAIARYNSNGTLDTTFGSGGRVILVIGMYNDLGLSTIIQGNGKILVAGWSRTSTNADFVVVRFNNDGSLDNNFDSDGIVTTDFGNSNEGGNAVALQSDGKIVVAGTSYNNSSYNGSEGDFALARYKVETTGIEKKNETINLTVYPNPTTGIFQINYSSTEKIKLTLNISNSKGQLIYTETISKFDGEYKKEIDLSKYAKGIYFIEIIGDRKRTIRKIIVE